jgi:hypothetical protein
MPKLRRFAKQAINLSIGSLILTSLALAAPSVATVTSAVPFVIDGHPASSPGVTSFPVVAGDTVSTTNGPAVLLFHDGSTVKLGENSSAKVDVVGANPKVVLLAGALDYKLVAGSNLKVTNLDGTRKDATTPDAASSVASSRGRTSSVLSSPAFIVSAGGSAVGVASGLMGALSGSSSVAASATTSASGSVLIAHVPPVSIHL